MSLRERIAAHSANPGAVTAVLAVMLPLCVFVSLTLGPVHIPLRGMVADLAGRHTLDPTLHVILLSLRLPHILTTAVIGAALSVAGMLFQGLFRNPLADPYVIGSSSGSLVGAAVAIFWFPAATFYGFASSALFAFLGAALTIGLVYLLAQSGTEGSSNTLLLAGFAIGTMLTGGAYLLETFSNDSSAGLRAMSAWLHGTIATPAWPQLGVVAAMLGAGVFLSWLLTHRLNALALGDEYAAQLGIPLERTRGAVIVVGALLTAAAVSLGGIIGFVGLIVPHVMRMLMGPDNRSLLPACALGGAMLVVVADIFARTLIAPSELPVGILMAFLGGPFFLFLLRRRPEVYA